MKASKPNRTVVTLLVLLIVAALLVAFGLLQQSLANADINSFEDCVASGRPILETYPEQCVGPDGTHYTKRYDASSSNGV